jgi:hypothetical protein
VRLLLQQKKQPCGRDVSLAPWCSLPVTLPIICTCVLVAQWRVCSAALAKGHAQAHAKDDSASPQEGAAAAAAEAESPAAQEGPAAAAQGAAAACGRLSRGRAERKVRRPERDNHRVGAHLLTNGCRVDCHWHIQAAHPRILGNRWRWCIGSAWLCLMCGASQLLPSSCSIWRIIVHGLMCYREAPVPSAYMSASLAWGNWNLWDAKSYQQVRMPTDSTAHSRTRLMTARCSDRALCSMPCVPVTAEAS